MTETVKQNFWSKVKYAFATDDESFHNFPDEEMNLLNKVADIIVRRKLTAPAVLFLESVRPLNFLGSQVIVFFQPIVSFVISTKELELFGKILEKRGSIPLLIDLIEKREQAGNSVKTGNNIDKTGNIPVAPAVDVGADPLAPLESYPGNGTVI